jgi:hypothetical protein
VVTKVRLSQALLEYAFSDHYIYPRSATPRRELKRDLRIQLRKDGSSIAGRKLKQAINATFSGATGKLGEYLQRKRTANNAWRTMVLLLTLPGPREIARAYCSNAKQAYTPQDIADILDEKGNENISKALDGFKRETSELFRWSNRAVHLRWKKMDGANINDWWISLDEDEAYEEERVHFVIFYVPKNMAGVEAVLQHPKMKTTRELCELWSAKVLSVNSTAELVLDVVIGRQSTVVHSRYFADGKQETELTEIFVDRPLASKPVFS